MKIPRTLALGAMAVTASFWLACVAVPSLRVLGRAQGLLDPDVIAVARATAWQASLSTAISAAIGLPLGLWLASSSRRSRAIDTLLLLPQGVPTVVAATAWVAWLGRSGPMSSLGISYSLTAVVVAHVFFNAPWVALLVAQARRQVSIRQLQAAATLGAGPLAQHRTVVWPAVKLAWATATAHVAAACSMSFALVLILGGGPPVETLETALYSRLRGGALDLGGAAACALWEIALTLTPWLIVLALGSRSHAEHALPSKKAAAPRIAVAALFFAPYLIITSGAQLPDLTEILEPLKLSLIIAATTALGAAALAAFALIAIAAAPRAFKAPAAALLTLPSGLSVLVLGLGFWLAYGDYVDPFEGSLAAIIALQITVFFPAAFRMLWPVAQKTPQKALQAAWSLGASPWQAFWHVDWPRWRSPLISALALTGGIALGEVAAVSLFYSQKLIPLPLVVSRAMAQYRFDQAQSVSVLLLFAAAALMAIVGAAGDSTHA